MSKLKITAGIKKILRILLFSAVGILLLVGVLYMLLRLPYVQTTLVKYITERIKEATGVHIQIGGVDFRPMSSLVLNDVLLKDFKNDTLVYCQDLRVKADSFSIVKRSFHIREILLNKACFHLWSSSGENSNTNIEMFLDSLQRGSVSSGGDGNEASSGDGWLMGLKKISIRHSHFTYRDEKFEPMDYGVNWTDVDCQDLEVDVSGFNFSEGPTEIWVAGLSLREKSGLLIRNLGGKVRMSEGNLLITDCQFELERSRVDLVKMEYNWTPDQHDWRYFVTRMNQYYELGPSSVSFIDLAYFNGILRGINNTVRCSGVVSNTIDKLEGHDLYFELGDHTVFQGSFKSEGLPDVRNTLFYIEMHKAHLSPKDLETVYLPWFERNIPVPAPLHHLPYLDFEKIKFAGILSDFVVQAKSVTPALAGELSFCYGPCEDTLADCSAMSGDFNFDRVDCGKLSGVPLVGYGMVSGDYGGVWDERGPSFHVNTQVHRLNVGKGNIRDAEVALTWEYDKLDLLASLDNEQVQGGMVLAYDMDDTLNFLSMRGKLKLKDLAAFGLGVKGGKESAEAVFDLVHAGREDKNFTNLTLSDAQYSDGRDSFSVRSICLEDNQFENYNATTLHSDIADISIEGNYREVRPLPFVFRLMQNYLPAYSEQKVPKDWKKNEVQDFGFHYAVRIKDANRVLRVFYPDLKLSGGVSIVSDFQSDNERLNLSLLADTIDYKEIRLLKSRIDITGDAKRLKMNYAADRVVYGAGYQLYNVRNQLQLADNHLDDRISWCNWENKTYSGNLAASVIFSPDEKEQYTAEVRIRPGMIVMDDSVWRVNESAVFIKGKNIRVNDFSIRRGREYLSVRGQIAEDPQEKLYINLENFNLENFTRIALSHRPAIFGMATGSLTVQDYYKDFLLISDFTVNQWGIHRDTLGSLHLRSYWDAENRSLIVGAENQVDDDVPLVVSGYYTPESDTLSVNVKLKKVGLERMGAYLSDYVSETEGYLSGNVNILGTSHKPDISGFVYLDSVGVKVNALNTNFYVHDSIHIVNNRFLFHDFGLRDVNGSKAFLNGQYQFWEDRYSLDARFQDFRLLNTGFIDNETFYGQVFLSGLAELDNKDGITNMTINAKTENDSRLYVPLSAGVVEQSNNFLHFLNSGQSDTRKNQVGNARSDMNLNANLELNDHLNVQVIFDPTVGDILKASGNGNIKVDFDKDGNLMMYGEYRISRGDYLFTLSNLVNKKFVLTPGGTISWSGSPYDAMLNINAVYNLKTTITELLPVDSKVSTDESVSADKTTSSESGRKVPVECILNLSDNLSNPVVKFDINFPSLETQSKSYIQSLFSSQDEINKQMFSLLVLNRFYRPDNVTDYGLQAQAASVTTVTEMMSNQLSRWLSQISNNVDIGLAYRVRDPNREITADEIEVALSTQLLNDRVTISANGNMDVGGAKNAAGEENKKTNIAGDFDIEVKMNKQGTLKMKAYSHTDEKLLYNNTETIQGVGVSYQESFDTFRELLRKYFGFLQRRK